jgi:short-subunit dehydrogenase
LQPIAPSVWIFDAPPIRVLGLPLPLRMTIIRLGSGEIILHSPTQFSPDLKAAIEQLGPIRYLVAPSVGHWTFLAAWQKACRNLTTYAVPGLKKRPQVRRAGVRVDHELGDKPPSAWRGEIETVLVRGVGFAEVDLFHRPSRTLVLTDLALNLEPQTLPIWALPLTRLAGLTAPANRPPPYVQAMLLAGARHTAAAAARLVAFQPERVVFAHGAWFQHDAAERLRRSLTWLTRAAPSEDFKGRVVVIAGASSGIGRAAALAFARRGANLVLAARRAGPLETLAQECRKLGVQAIVNTADVTDSRAMEQLAQRAVDAFGHVDVWINNAGTGVFGPFQDADMVLHRRTVEVNLLGAMNGAHAILPVFLRQGRGVLINTVSMGGLAPTPFAAAYTASKFGLRGFTASLREELSTHPHIHACALFPAMTDTPGFAHGANQSGAAISPGPLLLAPEEVAEAFVKLAREPRDEMIVGWPSRAAQLSWTLARGTTERVMGGGARRMVERARPAPKTEGAVLTSGPEGVEPTGGWLARRRLPSAQTVGRACAVGAALLLGATLGLAVRRGLRTRDRDH